MEIKPAGPEYVGAAFELVMAAIRKEKKVVSCLPPPYDYSHMLKQRIECLFACGTGIVATENYQVLGSFR